ncbi:flagellar hook-length control protein FliK [Erwinia sorbitola]|uniref:flagellar hook-length control protein FliK n=1 Tax=Erwinia sorbitola TaxID=2681984 RepID=UPI001E2B647A|nr:flagellar hook-length control protein FliK [Erwinia sorbitola]
MPTMLSGTGAPGMAATLLPGLRPPAAASSLPGDTLEESRLAMVIGMSSQPERESTDLPAHRDIEQQADESDPEQLLELLLAAPIATLPEAMGTLHTPAVILPEAQTQYLLMDQGAVPSEAPLQTQRQALVDTQPAAAVQTVDAPRVQAQIQPAAAVQTEDAPRVQAQIQPAAAVQTEDAPRIQAQIQPAAAVQTGDAAQIQAQVQPAAAVQTGDAAQIQAQVQPAAAVQTGELARVQAQVQPAAAVQTGDAAQIQAQVQPAAAVQTGDAVRVQAQIQPAAAVQTGDAAQIQAQVQPAAAVQTEDPARAQVQPQAQPQVGIVADNLIKSAARDEVATENASLLRNSILATGSSPAALRLQETASAGVKTPEQLPAGKANQLSNEPVPLPAILQNAPTKLATPADALLVSRSVQQVLRADREAIAADSVLQHPAPALFNALLRGEAAGKTLPAIVLPAAPEQQAEALHKALAERLEMQIDRGVQKATIRLDPPNMGKVDISIHFESGKLQVQIQAAQPEVARLLQQISNEMRASLSEQNNVQVNVQVSTHNGDSRQQQRHHKPPELAIAENNEEVTTAQRGTDGTILTMA